ncbi:MAG TPA: ExeM/NucH family extracellular endonuclease [Pyrinomonadaceae bacterium]
MRSKAFALIALFSLLIALFPERFIPLDSAVHAAPSPNLVISQVYGGGGNSGAPYTHDFIELYNRGTVAVPLNGMSLQYASATGTGNYGSSDTQKTELPSVMLQPGQYFLVQESGGTTGVPLTNPDVIDSTPIAMSGTAGKVALVTGTTTLGCNGAGNPCTTTQLARVVDLVGYGAVSNGAGSFETAAAPGLSNSTAALRANGGATDTDNNSADFTAGPPNPRSSTDAAPSVSSTVPTSGASNVSTSANLTVNFSEPVNGVGNWFTISCGSSGSHTAAVTGGPKAFTLNPDSDFLNGEQCTVTILAGQVEDQDPVDPPNNMVANYSWTFNTVAADPCTSPFTNIYTVQGSGSASPFPNGTNKTIRGIVTGDFQGSAGLDGFFVQDQTGDNNPATSDGIFVFAPGGTDVAVGDDVVVSGKVSEFNGLTELGNVSTITRCGTGSIAPTTVHLPETVDGELERYEGMLVTIPETLTVSENFNLGRYGELMLSAGGRMFQPNNFNLPKSPGALAEADANARRRIVLDDGKSIQNPNPIPYLGPDNTLRAGDTTSGLTGLLDFRFSEYVVQPSVTPTFTQTNPRTAAPEPVNGNVKVVSMNVLNYFNGNGSGLDGSAGGFPTSRGASNLAEFQRQRAKIIAAILAINADVLGIIEMENDGSGPATAIQDLVNGLNSATAPGTYAFRLGLNPGTDLIRNAIIYKPARVTPLGDAVNDVDTDGDNAWTQARNPLAQTFQYNPNSEKFTLIVNHFTSKGCSADDKGLDADQGDGQGCDNYRRMQQAQRLLLFIAERQAAAGDDDVLVMGDLNAYGKDDPIRALTDGGLVNQIEQFIEHPYSYVFGGESGYLDHALTTTSLSSQVSGVTEWHINADEPIIIDYNKEFKPPSPDLYAATPYRSSDHDPVIVGLELNAPPTADAGGPYNVNEGGSVTVTAAGSDPDNDALTYDWDLDNDGNFEVSNQQSVSFSAAGLDGPSSRTIRVRVSDATHSTTDEATVNIANVAPSVGAVTVTPNPVLLNSSVNAGASFTDPGTPDTHTASWNWGDGQTSVGVVTESNGSGSVTGSHTYNTIGSYNASLTVTDDDAGSGSNSVQVNVTYGIVSLFDQTEAHKSGSTIPIKLQLVDANGNNLSGANKTVHLVSVTFNSVIVGGPDYDSGNSNRGNNFRFDPVLGGYIFNLSTKSLGSAPGEYTVNFTVAGDPVIHTITFTLR